MISSVILILMILFIVIICIIYALNRGFSSIQSSKLCILGRSYQVPLSIINVYKRIPHTVPLSIWDQQLLFLTGYNSVAEIARKTTKTVKKSRRKREKVFLF